MFLQGLPPHLKALPESGMQHVQDAQQPPHTHGQPQYELQMHNVALSGYCYTVNYFLSEAFVPIN